MRDLLKVVQAILAELDCPRALTVKIMIDNAMWTELIDLSARPTDYDTADRYRRATQATDVLRKADFLPSGIDLHGRAVETFFKAESQCYLTNERLYQYVFQPPRLSGPAPEAILALARQNIEVWLGKFSDLRVAELAGHGPGTTYDDRGATCTVADKMSSDPTLTSETWPWLVPFSGTAWARALNSDGFAKRSPRFVPGNRFVSVPKDSGKNRGIAIEPSLNVYYQLGVGRLMRERLRRGAGVDLQYAQDIHRADARLGSLTGECATIDLSNASDTVCKNLVKILIPPDWYEALCSVRSPKTFIEGKWVLLEKFSSMGNGFTFELETVIFLSLAAAVSQYLGIAAFPGRELRVYGDDIIVPTSMSAELLTVLGFCGFTPNLKKTFIDGPFRESCGGDYFMGEAVRPLFIKELPSEPFDWMVLANRIHASFGPKSVAWRRTLDHLPTIWRDTTGPAHLGDVCLHTTSNWQRRTKHDIHYNRAWKPLHRQVPWAYFRPDVVLACALYGTGSGQHYGGLTPRDAVTGYVQTWIADS